MATIDLGKIKMVWRGAYDNATAYTPDDVVSSGGSSYICILASTGNAVSNATYWSLLAQGGTDVGATLTTQGDILYRDGSGLQRLAPGTSGQVLQTGGAAANPSWVNSSGGLLKTAFSEMTSQVTLTHTAWQSVSTAINFTPTSSSSKLVIMYGTTTYVNSGVGCAFRLNIAGSVHGTNQWSTQNPLSHYSGSGTDYSSPFFITQYNNTSTSAKNIVVEGIRMDSSTNAYANYNGRVSQMYIMETGV